MARAVGRALSRMGVSRVAPVSGSWWLTEAPSSLATHRPSASAARATGLAATPTGWPTLPAAASRRTIVLSVALATHNPSPAATMAVGPLPTSMVWTTRPVGMLIRDTVRSPLLATQTESAVEVMPYGRPPDVDDPDPHRALGEVSTWETVSAPVLVTRTEPPPTAMPPGRVPTQILADDLSRAPGSMMPIESSPHAREGGSHREGFAMSKPACREERPPVRRPSRPSARGRRCQMGRDRGTPDGRRTSFGGHRPGPPVVDELGDCPTRSTASTRHSPGTPFNSRTPRSSKVRLEPVVRSRTVDDTSTSPGCRGGHDARGDDDGQAGHLFCPKLRPRRRGRRATGGQAEAGDPAFDLGEREGDRGGGRVGRSRRSRRRRCGSLARRRGVGPFGRPRDGVPAVRASRDRPFGGVLRRADHVGHDDGGEEALGSPSSVGHFAECDDLERRYKRSDGLLRLNAPTSGRTGSGRPGGTGSCRRARTRRRRPCCREAPAGRGRPPGGQGGPLGEGGSGIRHLELQRMVEHAVEVRIAVVVERARVAPQEAQEVGRREVVRTHPLSMICVRFTSHHVVPSGKSKVFLGRA